MTGLYPAYIRGLAYLGLGDGRSAASEFQKLIGHPYLVSSGNISLISLSHLQLARAQVLEGDKAAAKKDLRAVPYLMEGRGFRSADSQGGESGVRIVALIHKILRKAFDAIVQFAQHRHCTY